MLSSLPALSYQLLPSLLFAAQSRVPTRTRDRAPCFVPLSFVVASETKKKSNRNFRPGFLSNDCKINRNWTGFTRRCRDWDSDESDLALEAEILEFMKSSERPEKFPSRTELVDGGRIDLVDAIVQKRGWLSFGWNLDDEEEQEQTVRGFNGYGGFEEDSDWSSGEEEEEEIKSRSSSVSLFCPYDVDYSQSASLSSRSLEMAAAGNESGIEGILSRLEKERSVTFGFDSANNVEDRNFSASDDGDKDWQSRFSTDGTVAGLFKSGNSSSLRPKKAIFDKSSRRLNQNHSISEVNGLRNPQKPDTWRDWSIQRAGLSDINSKDSVKDGIRKPEIADEAGERGELDIQKHKKINPKQIQSRLRHLELELSTVLDSVRSAADDILSNKDQESSSDEMQKLTDAWEFQENEIMNAQDKLRSTRAKIAVLEGKMALALIDTQKIMERKQKRIDDARRALRLLRSTCIVWPNSASEVLLAGSFDGWASKRKMEKSRNGIFSLWLQLYPGRYEIKFIVDGEWRTDPLRPTVNNNGHENNLLMVI